MEAGSLQKEPFGGYESPIFHLVAETGTFYID